MPQGNPIFASQGTTIFTVMSALATEHNAINLGQGFPDEDGPLAVREAASRALLDGPNQYPPMKGRAELRRAIAGHAKRFYDLDFNPETEVLITSGATEALTASIMGLVGQGDEVVLVEPAYDSYRPIVESTGAVIKTIKLALYVTGALAGRLAFAKLALAGRRRKAKADGRKRCRSARR